MKIMSSGSSLVRVSSIVSSPYEALSRRTLQTKNVFLIANEGSADDVYLAALVIYDLSRLHPVTIVTWSSAKLVNQEITQYPSLFRISGEGSMMYISRYTCTET